jgi:hypothetical protein
MTQQTRIILKQQKNKLQKHKKTRIALKHHKQNKVQKHTQQGSISNNNNNKSSNTCKHGSGRGTLSSMAAEGMQQGGLRC